MADDMATIWKGSSIMVATKERKSMCSRENWKVEEAYLIVETIAAASSATGSAENNSGCATTAAAGVQVKVCQLQQEPVPRTKASNNDGGGNEANGPRNKSATGTSGMSWW